MGKSRLLRQADVRAALRLVGECRDLGHDPGEWGRHMFAGLCRLTGARAGNGGELCQARPRGPVEGVSYYDSGFGPREHDLYVEFLTTHGVDAHPIAGGVAGSRTSGSMPGRPSVRSRRQLVPDSVWYGSLAYNEYHRVIRIDHCIVSPLEVTAGGFSCIILHRATGEREFAPRYRRQLHLFHEELGRLIGPVLVSAGDPHSPTRLPARVQETLRCLLEGDGEKQAAARMGLSRETVHQYVKALYQHYRVSSRAELLARILRRTDPSG
jgi:DNA-binding CsgD family transcriptional regulator